MSAGGWTAKDVEDVITDGMLRWDPDTLPTTTLIRLATDALADLWRDCYRRGDNNLVVQRTIFKRKLENIVECATGQSLTAVVQPLSRQTHQPRPSTRKPMQ